MGWFQSLFGGRNKESDREALRAHVERYVGPVVTAVMAEEVPMSVLIVAPTQEQPLWTLVSWGMSGEPMRAPPQASDRRYAELVLRLPRDWPLTCEFGSPPVWGRQEDAWPLGLLASLADFPHAQRRWLWAPQTIDITDQAEPIAPGVRFEGAMLVPCLTLPGEFGTLAIDPKKEVSFFALALLYRDELGFAQQHGGGEFALLAGRDELAAMEVVNPSRPSVLEAQQRRAGG